MEEVCFNKQFVTLKTKIYEKFIFTTYYFFYCNCSY
jgi:hypothetical protein